MSVSRSGYYRWRSATPGPRARRTAGIRLAVQQIYKESHGIFGSVKIAKELQSDDTLETACRNTVAKAMRDLGLRSRVCKKFRPTTTQSAPPHAAANNVLSQDFSADAPDRKWVADITYIPIASGWVYLAVVIDLFSRKVVGWHLADSLSTPLIATALKNAINSRQPDTSKLLHHSDRGCQYTSGAFQSVLKTMNITCSMSRTGNCYDNAVAERFFWSLKHEWTNHQTYRSAEDVRTSVFGYIETFYNTRRIHQTLSYQSPNDFEKRYHETLTA